MYCKGILAFILLILYCVTNFTVRSLIILDKMKDIVDELTLPVYEYCINTKPLTLKTISNLKEAISHYKGKSGKTVSASNKLIAQMKAYVKYQHMLTELGSIMKNKITYEKIKNKELIKAEPGSRRGLWCIVLGSYSVNIDYAFYPKNGWNTVNIHFTGYDTWDFEWNDSKSVLYNFVEESLPNLCAGIGRPFNITYDFYDVVTFYKYQYLKNVKRSNTISDDITNLQLFNSENITQLYHINIDNGFENIKYFSFQYIISAIMLMFTWWIFILH